MKGKVAYSSTLYGNEFKESTALAPEYEQGHVKVQHLISYSGTFTVKNGTEEVFSGSKYDEGTLLTVVATPADGYLLKSIKVNGTAISGTTFNLAGNSEITVEFTNKLTYTSTIGKGGTVVAKIGETALATGSEFDHYNSHTEMFISALGSKVTVYNLSGVEVAAGEGSIDVSKLISDNYIAKVVTDKTVDTVKFCKM